MDALTNLRNDCRELESKIYNLFKDFERKHNVRVEQVFLSHSDSLLDKDYRKVTKVIVDVRL